MEEAKIKASESYQELISLRNDLNQSIEYSHNNNSNDKNDNLDLNHSIAETDKLLLLFRNSINNFSESTFLLMNQNNRISNISNKNDNNNDNTIHSSNLMNSMSQFESSVEVSNILEKYSDKLLDLVAEKIANKFNNSKI